MGLQRAILMKFIVPELRDESKRRGLRMARVKPELVQQLMPHMCLSAHTAARVAELLGWAPRPEISELMQYATARA